MRTMPLYPLRFEPILSELIWGGRRLGTVLHKPIGEASDYAESWEISDYRDQVSVVGEGPLAGTTLRDLVRIAAAELLGPGGRAARAVPAPGQVHRRPPGPLGPGPSRRREGPAPGRRQRQDRGLGDPRRRAGQPDLRRPEAGRRARTRSRRGDRRGRGRAAAAPVRAQAGRLHPDPGRHRPRDRRGGGAGRDPADVRRHVPRLRLGPRRPRRQAPRAPHPSRRWNRSTSSGARSTRSRRTRRRSPAAALASGWRGRSTSPWND